MQNRDAPLFVVFPAQHGDTTMAGNADLNHASRAKQDEFYTQLADIEAELRHYRNHFREKTVFCNCDDPYESNFFRYFAMDFNISWAERKTIPAAVRNQGRKTMP